MVGEITRVGDVLLPPLLQTRIVLLNEWFNTKAQEVFVDVSFAYGDELIWIGTVPLIVPKHGFRVEDAEQYVRVVIDTFDAMDPSEGERWSDEQRTYWSGRERGETFKVYEVLASTRTWTCRSCGPTKEASGQAAARVRWLVNGHGYTIATRRMACANCGSKFHDLLVRLPRWYQCEETAGAALRAPMSEELKERIKRELGHVEVVSNRSMPGEMLVIDHKFPSQRWGGPEGPNPEDMACDEIERKFQLLTNGTNMLKSRKCDECVRSGVRGDFFDLSWYPDGGRQWDGEGEHDEGGCVGCPWYDVAAWRESFNQRFSQDV